jgi:hypothetical protein
MDDREARSDISGITETEAIAERLLLVAETIALDGGSQARAAMRYANRLAFSLGHVDDLRHAAMRDGGVFAPARLQVALSILEVHARSTAQFIDPIVAPARQSRTRRDARLVALDITPEEMTQADPSELAA